MAIFNSYMLVYQRVPIICGKITKFVGENAIGHPVRTRRIQNYVTTTWKIVCYSAITTNFEIPVHVH